MEHAPGFHGPFCFVLYLGLFLLPFGLPRRLISVIHFGGRPRRFPCPTVSRSSTAIASVICSRSARRSASILLMSIVSGYLRVSHFALVEFKLVEFKLHGGNRPGAIRDPSPQPDYFVRDPIWKAKCLFSRVRRTDR
jgi:hypothetical protein